MSKYENDLKYQLQTVKEKIRLSKKKKKNKFIIFLIFCMFFFVIMGVIYFNIYNIITDDMEGAFIFCVLMTPAIIMALMGREKQEEEMKWLKSESQQLESKIQKLEQAISRERREEIALQRIKEKEEKKLQIVEEQVLNLMDRGKNLRNLKKFDNALKLFREGLNLLKPYKQMQGISVLEEKLNLEIKIIEKLINDDKLKQIYDDKLKQIKTIKSLGDQFKSQLKFEKALKEYQKALKIARDAIILEKPNDIDVIKSSCNEIYSMQIIDLIENKVRANPIEFYNDSIKNLDNALDISKKMFNSPEKNQIQTKINQLFDFICTKRINELIDKGSQSRKQMEFDESIQTFRTAIEITKKITNKDEIHHFLTKIEDLISQTQVTKIKNTILNLGVKFDRLHLSEIAEKCSESEDKILNVALDMIRKKEIYAEYFKSTSSVVFDKQANIIEIDILMNQYKKWEEKDIGKINE